MDSLLIVTEKHEGGVATGLNVHHNVSRGEQFETIVYHFDGTTHWGSLVEGDEQLDRLKQKAVVFVLNPQKIMQQMHGIIP